MKILRILMINLVLIMAISFLKLNAVLAFNESEVKYFKATLLDIDGLKYNEKMRKISNADYQKLDLESKARYDENLMLFGSCYGNISNGHANLFRGPGQRVEVAGVLQGLAKNRLVNSNIVFNDNIQNANTLFPNSKLNGDEYVEYLKDCKFPFKKEKNGYYTFNSNNEFVIKDTSQEKFILKSGKKGGFYPFNKEHDDTNNESIRNLYFSAKFEIPFIMTKDGKVLNSETGEYDDMIFEFSGDDDVWVFIDDELVLDLGGTHIELSGNINLAKNTVWYESILDENKTKTHNNVTRNILNNKLKQGKHVLRLFYLERAGGISNLKTRFNLQSSGIKIRHIDRESGNILSEEYVAGEVGKNIRTNSKEIENYELVERPQNEEFELKEEEQIVNYYYSRKYKIISRYIDINSNKEIESSIETIGLVNSNYDTIEKSIDGYVLTKIPDNKSGIITKNDEVKYLYKKKSKIIVNYIDKFTKENMDRNEFEGFESDTQLIEEKDFKNYELIEKPSNNKIKFESTEKTINYYYVKKAKLIINYIDKTKNKILEKIEEEKREGEEYESNEKEYENYKLVKKPENSKGKIGREDVILNYEYELIKLNLKLDINIIGGNIKGKQYDLYGKLVKFDIPTKDFKSSEGAKIKYSIVVENNEEKDTDAMLEIKLPSGYYIDMQKHSDWNWKNDLIYKEIKNLKTGEKLKFELEINKNGNEEISETLELKGKVVSINKIEETNLEDNESIAKAVIVPKTGKITIISSVVLILLGVGYLVIRYILKRLKK